MPVYFDNPKTILFADHYVEYFSRRGIKYANIRRTKSFEDAIDIELEIREEHIWSHGDTLMRISQKYYGNSSLWYIIGFINKKPTDQHYSIGDKVMIVDNINILTGVL
jgi:hypothetical protein